MNYLDLLNLRYGVELSGIWLSWTQELCLLCVLIYELCVGKNKDVGGTTY